jgi:eukaryotic-like serine/threonine-protein kinase
MLLALAAVMHDASFESFRGLRMTPGSSVDRPSLPVSPGDVVAGKYLVGDVIAYGGMGVVVAATHQELRADVALKIVRSELATDEALVARFLNEARAAASLKSEHVARVIDCGKLESGAPFLVMEHLDGMDLRARLERGGALPIEEVVDYVLQVCEGLADAHAAGIVHRDIKPENLFVTTSVCGRPIVKILDFGISKRITHSLNRRSLTIPGMSIGSPWYMSPEQTRASVKVDERTDLWSLGVVLFELLTGARPFEGETIAVVSAQVLTHDPVNPCALRPEIPATLGAAILRCLDRDPEGRFQNVGALANALQPHAGANAPRAIASGHPFAFASAEVLDDVASRDTAPSSGCLGGVVNTRARLSTSKIPGVRSRRPFLFAAGTFALAGALLATFRHQGYTFEDIALDRSSVSGAWASVESGAADTVNLLSGAGAEAPPPPLPAVAPAMQPPPAVELPSELGVPPPATPPSAKPEPVRVAPSRMSARFVRQRPAAPAVQESLPPSIATAKFASPPAYP